jgi:hypothetical protein
MNKIMITERQAKELAKRIVKDETNQKSDFFNHKTLNHLNNIPQENGKGNI